jgi:hypothetical protein
MEAAEVAPVETKAATPRTKATKAAASVGKARPKAATKPAPDKVKAPAAKPKVTRKKAVDL